MATPKDVLVVTTSSVEGLRIKKYLKPVSAHIVAGTNLFSDFFASFSDVFGGRSQTYQNQLISLYSEAIERIKYAAYEIGGNCIVGLSIDMDEISGKGKSMFMLTAVGTAVVLEKEASVVAMLPRADEKFENIGVDKINILRRKKAIIVKANAGSLALNDDIWNFITVNQVDEVFPFLLKRYLGIMSNEQIDQAPSDNFYKLLLGYIDGMPDQKKLDLLYSAIEDEPDEQIALKLSEMIKALELFDFGKTAELIKGDNFQVKKRAVRIATYDKSFYNKQDIADLQVLQNLMLTTFNERGKRTMKKQLLSSKEKEVWSCECGKNNDLDNYCSGCGQDIYGFKKQEVKPDVAANYIKQKIELISEFVEL